MVPARPMCDVEEGSGHWLVGFQPRFLQDNRRSGQTKATFSVKIGVSGRATSPKSKLLDTLSLAPGRAGIGVALSCFPSK